MGRNASKKVEIKMVKRIKKHKGKIGLAMLALMLASYGKLFTIIGLSFVTDMLNVYLVSTIGFNIGSIIIAVGMALVVWKIMGGK